MNMLLMGYYGSRNLGDEMMLYCLLRWLEGQGVKVTLLCEGSREPADRYNVPAVENLALLLEWGWVDVWLRVKAPGLIRRFWQTDGLIVGGGDLIRDDRGWRNFMYTMEKILLAIAFRKPVFLLNIGIGRPRTWYGRYLLTWSLRRCRQIVVRDLRSLEICRTAGAEASLAPDIVTLLPQWLEAGRDAEAQLRPYIAVCLRSRCDVFGQFQVGEAGLRNLAHALDRLARERGLDIVFIPFQTMAAEHENDNEIHTKIAALMQEQSRVVIREWTGNLAAVTQCIAGAACVIAMRLHAAILAAACGRPCAVLPYDYKVGEAARIFNITCQITPTTLASFAELTAVLERALGPECPQRLTGAAACWERLALQCEPAPAR
ncbi:MAG: polysaccharide pyruvyl transferase family protein [Terriglobia bacterium]